MQHQGHVAVKPRHIGQRAVTNAANEVRKHNGEPGQSHDCVGNAQLTGIVLVDVEDDEFPLRQPRQALRRENAAKPSDTHQVKGGRAASANQHTGAVTLPSAVVATKQPQLEPSKSKQTPDSAPTPRLNNSLSRAGASTATPALQQSGIRNASWKRVSSAPPHTTSKPVSKRSAAPKPSFVPVTAALARPSSTPSSSKLPAAAAVHKAVNAKLSSGIFFCDDDWEAVPLKAPGKPKHALEEYGKNKAGLLPSTAPLPKRRKLEQESAKLHEADVRISSPVVKSRLVASSSVDTQHDASMKLQSMPAPSVPEQSMPKQQHQPAPWQAQQQQRQEQQLAPAAPLPQAAPSAVPAPAPGSISIVYKSGTKLRIKISRAALEAVRSTTTTTSAPPALTHPSAATLAPPSAPSGATQLAADTSLSAIAAADPAPGIAPSTQVPPHPSAPNHHRTLPTPSPSLPHLNRTHSNTLTGDHHPTSTPNPSLSDATATTTTTSHRTRIKLTRPLRPATTAPSSPTHFEPPSAQVVLVPFDDLLPTSSPLHSKPTPTHPPATSQPLADACDSTRSHSSCRSTSTTLSLPTSSHSLCSPRHFLQRPPLPPAPQHANPTIPSATTKPRAPSTAKRPTSVLGRAPTDPKDRSLSTQSGDATAPTTTRIGSTTTNPKPSVPSAPPARLVLVSFDDYDDDTPAPAATEKRRPMGQPRPAAVQLGKRSASAPEATHASKLPRAKADPIIVEAGGPRQACSEEVTAVQAGGSRRASAAEEIVAAVASGQQGKLSFQGPSKHGAGQQVPIQASGGPAEDCSKQVVGLGLERPVMVPSLQVAPAPAACTSAAQVAYQQLPVVEAAADVLSVKQAATGGATTAGPTADVSAGQVVKGTQESGSQPTKASRAGSTKASGSSGFGDFVDFLESYLGTEL